MTESMLEKLRAGRTLLGFCNMYPASGIIENVYNGWDWAWIDEQHGQHDYNSLLQAVRTAKSVGLDSIVRPATHDSGLLGRYADMAPDGLMIPMINNAEQARNIVKALRFAPLGARSLGGRRPIDLYGRGYYKESDLLVMAQIETNQALENAEAIIGTEGIDTLFFGADDMRVQMGLHIDTPIMESKELRQAMEKVAQAARKAGKYAGCIAATTDMFEMVLDFGYQIIVSGGDNGFLRKAFAEQIKLLQNVLDNRSNKAAVS